MRQRPGALSLTQAAAIFAVLLGRRAQAFVGPLGKRVVGRTTGAPFKRCSAYAARLASAADSRRNARSRLLASIAPKLIETIVSSETVSVAAPVGSTATSEEARVDAFNPDGTRKTGAQIRDEYFMAALTGSERGLPVGSFLNDTVEATPGVTQVSVVWQPYDDTIVAPAGSSLLKSAVDCGAMTIDNTFCLTGQCEACMTELDGKIVLACMVPIPTDGRTEVEALVCNSDAAWDDMMV